MTYSMLMLVQFFSLSVYVFENEINIMLLIITTHQTNFLKFKYKCVMHRNFQQILHLRREIIDVTLLITPRTARNSGHYTQFKTKQN